MFNLKIVTPQKEFFNDEIIELVLRSSEGDFAILSNHVDKIAKIVFSAGMIKTPSGERFFTTSGGMFTMFDNEAVLLSNHLKWEEITKKDLVSHNDKLLKINNPVEIIEYFSHENS